MPTSVTSKPELGLGIRPQFPVFAANGGALAYLDTAASSQKPISVIDRMSEYLRSQHANIHRGAYVLSAHATELYDEARAKVASFIGAKKPEEVVFVRGATEGINLVAHGIEKQIKPGDPILLSLLEHHSNIVPWQMLASRTGAKVHFADIHDDGSLDFADFKKKLSALKPKIVGITAMSNALGSITPLEQVIAESHKTGALVVVDGAQGVAHLELDVDAMDIDFLSASAHKLYGPTGVGFLYGKAALLEMLEPFQGGGDMIASVTTEGSTWAEVPRKFEAGTPAIAEAVAFGSAVDFVLAAGTKEIARHEDRIFHYGLERLLAEPDVTVFGPITRGGKQASILSFTVKGVHPHDLATVLDESHKVQIRAGHHCAMPLLKRLGLQSTARASVGIYSATEDFDRLIEGIKHARKMFS